MHRLAVPVLALGLLAGCAAQQPAGPPLMVPAALQAGLTDPGRTAIGIVAAVFPNPASVRGQPVAVANAISDLEWLAVSLATDQRWTQMPPTVASQVRRGRDAVRSAFLVPADAQTNAVIAAFDGAARGLSTGNTAAATASLATVTGAANAPRALALLSDLPAIPPAAQAASQAQAGLSEMDNLSMPRR